VFEYIEAFYNRRRRHSTLGMLSPVDYEQLQPAAGHAERPPVLENNLLNNNNPKNHNPSVTQTGAGPILGCCSSSATSAIWEPDGSAATRRKR
jgi:hypothetical protein